MAPSGIPLIGLYGLVTPHVSHTAPESLSGSSPPPMSISSFSDSTSTSEQSFTDPVAMPPPGVEHYEARRARWLTPPTGETREPLRSTSRAKIEALLAADDVMSNDAAWDGGLHNIWKGLVGGGRLRRRLPLGLVIKILQAGWFRDGTWPANSLGAPLPAPPDDADRRHDAVKHLDLGPGLSEDTSSVTRK